LRAPTPTIRFPSAANGVTGLKPTWGRVSRYGVFALAESLDHIGPMTRSAADAAAVLSVIAGADPNDPTAVPAPVPNYLAGLPRGIRGVRIAVDRAFNTTGVDKDMVKVVDDAIAVLTDLGADIREARFPSPDQIVKDWLPLCAVETAVAHEATFPKHADQYGPALRGIIESGRALSGFDLTKILIARAAFRGEVEAFFQDVDLLATLGEDPKALEMLLRFTSPFDVTGSPTITLPGGFTAKRLPVAFQLVSRPLEEDLLLRAGHAFQLATDWHKRRPLV
jgi:amidase